MSAKSGPVAEQFAELSLKAKLFYDDERYDQALAPAQEARGLAIKAFGERDPKSLSAAYQLARTYWSLDRFDEAEPLYRENLKLRRSVLGRRHKDTVKTLYYLAKLYQNRGSYDLAVPLFEETVQTTTEDFGVEQTVTQIAMDSLADTYRGLTRYGDAEPLYRQLLEVRRDALGNRHADTRDTIDDLAWLYENMGRYAEAEPLFEELVTIDRDILGDRHVATLSAINGLAIIYRYQGRYDEAEPLYLEALEGRREVLGERHQRTLGSMNNLALLYQSQGHFDRAQDIFEEALALKREVLGERHPDTLNAINNLGNLYQDQGRYGQAGEAYQEALRLRRIVLGERHPETLRSLNNLARIYIRHTRYDDAVPLFDQAFKLRREILGERHPDTLASEFGLVYAFMTSDRIDQAVATLEATADDRLAYAEAELASTQGAGVRSLLLNRQGHFQDYVFSLALRHKRPDTLALAGDVMLHWKQVQGAEAAFIAHLARTDNDPDVKALGQDVIDLRTRLARASQKETSGQNPVAILEELEAKEHALARISGAFKRRRDVRRPSIDQIEAVLPDNSGVVEFRQFVPVNDQGGRLGVPRFIALLVRPGQPPLLANAGEVEDVERLLATIRRDPIAARADKAAADLREQLFSGFGNNIEALDKVYIAPDGILNLVPFDRLKLADGRYWGDEQPTRILYTSRDLLQEQPATSEQATGLLALGGVDFDSDAGRLLGDPASTPDLTIAAVDQDVLQTARGEVRAVFQGFQPLEGSAIEVEKIERIFRDQRPRDSVTVWTGEAASEARLKSLDGLASPPRVLHVATHGFFLADPRRKLILPQLHSGLVLAGANRGLTGDDPNDEDGILYSLEAQSLNLEGTELVVLSACDTGKGVIDYSEGVVGLVQALRIAGAKQVLMTLWPILDDATAVFMETFYTIWLARPKQGPAEALDATKTIFRTHENPAYRSPNVWAPFVLIGA